MATTRALALLLVVILLLIFSMPGLGMQKNVGEKGNLFYHIKNKELEIKEKRHLKFHLP